MIVTTIVVLILGVIYTMLILSIVKNRAHNTEEDILDSLNTTNNKLEKFIDMTREIQKRDFNILLSLAGYKNLEVNEEDRLLLAEDFDGDKYIAEECSEPITFFPAKEIKTKKVDNNKRTVLHEGKTYEYEVNEKEVHF